MLVAQTHGGGHAGRVPRSHDRERPHWGKAAVVAFVTRRDVDASQDGVRAQAAAEGVDQGGRGRNNVRVHAGVGRGRAGRIMAQMYTVCKT
jgi:hypothetical protein